MKTCCRLLFLTWLLSACPAPGQEPASTPGPPTITLTYPAETGIAGSSIPPGTDYAATPIYACGGEPLTFIVAAQAPLGTRLRICADVTQQAGGIAVPWQRSALISEEVVFGDRTFLWVACKLPVLRTVQRKTRVSLTLHTEVKILDGPGGAGGRGFVYPRLEPGAWRRQPGGVAVRGFVYPREEPGAWQRQFAALLARSGLRRVAVFGGWKNTAAFLREQKVAFDDLGDDWPSEPDAHTLYLGSVFPKGSESTALSVPKVFQETPGVRLILFEPWETDEMPPGVYQTASTVGGSVWKVTLPDLFVGLGPDAPHGLETLTAILRQALSPRQPAADASEPTSSP